MRTRLRILPMLLTVFFISPLFLTCKTTSPVADPSAIAATRSAHSSQIVSLAFDWDDNIFIMPTEIMIMNRKTGKEHGVSSQRFAIIRQNIGKPGTEWADYELSPSETDGAFRFMGDAASDHINHFQKDIETAISTKDYRWQGPVWQDFVSAMSQPSTAAQTSIITARGHEPITIQNALKKLVSRGLIKNVPPVENIWSVGGPSFTSHYKQVFKKDPPAGSTASPSLRKAAVMEQLLDQINAHPPDKNSVAVLHPDGSKKVPLNLWGFSDDDFGNFSGALSVLQNGVDRNRWPNVKITLFFTGTNNPTEKPHAIVLREKQTPRPFIEAEEWKAVTGIR